MATWVNRKYVSDWFENSFRTSSIAHLTGLLGVGKTAATRHYLKSQNKLGTEAVKWHTFVKALDITAILGFEGESLESALLQASQSWKIGTVCVWDDVHLLKPNVQYALIQFLKNQDSPAQHVLISEESLTQFLGFEIPTLVLGGLSLDEFKTFMSHETSNMDQETLFQKTRGNLLLIQMGLRTGEFQLNIKSLTSGLSNQAQLMFTTIALLPEGLPLKMIDTLQWNQDVVDELTRRHLMAIDEGRMRISAFSSATLENYLMTQDLSPCLALLSKYQDQLGLSRFSQWRLLLRSQKKIQVENFPVLEPSELENIPIDILESDLKQMSQIEFAPNSAIESQKLRLQLASLIYLGDRKAAMKWLDSTSLEWAPKTPEHRLWFLFDAVYWRNRSNEIEKASTVASQLVNQAQAPLKQFLQIEMALPYVEIDPPRALETLHRVQSQIEKLEEGRVRAELSASAEYQIATCYFNQENFKLAQAHYEKSKIIYEGLKKTYFAAFALLNQAWCHYHLREWQKFESSLEELKKIVLQFGYRYLSVGLDLLEGLLAVENLRESDALRLFSLAEHQTRKFTMRKPWQDAAFEKAKLLTEIGQFGKAMSLISELKPQLSKADTRQKLIEVLEKFESLSQEELRDLFPEGSTSLDAFIRRCLRMREIIPPPVGELSLKDQVLECELGIRQAARARQQSVYHSAVLRLGSALEGVHEPRFERVGYYCVQATLQNSEEEKQHLLEMAELELARVISEASDKRALNAWIECLRKGTSLKVHNDFKNLPHFTQVRWLSWEFVSSETKEAFSLIGPQGTKFSDEPPSPLTSGLTVDETRGDVYWRKKKIAEFSKKPVLRQILIRLLESYPESLSKPALSSSVWGESYSPLVHDSRIYTSVQRIRQLLKADTIENWSLGYRIHPELDFILIRSTQPQARSEDRTQSLILQALKKRKSWMKKAELLEATDSTDSTLKRALSVLLEEGKIERQGAGPAVQYRWKTH